MSNIDCSSYKRCTLLVKEDVYRRLKAKGRFGESFSTLIDRLLDELDNKKTEKEVVAS
jgi:predicted CopG family antitoxin